MTRYLVDATRTRRQIQGLALSGWRFADLAIELGTHTCNIPHLTRQARVTLLTQSLVDQLTDKLRDKTGTSTQTARRAHTQLWLPLEAWHHSDINSTHPLAEVTALLGWLAYGDNPRAAITELMRRYHQLPLIAQQITARRGHALYTAGDLTPAVHQAELLYQRHHWTPRLPQSRELVA
jgi:hypothetical protein